MLQHIQPFVKERDENNTLRIRQIENQMTLAAMDSQFFVNLWQGFAKQWPIVEGMASLLNCVNIRRRLMFTPCLNRIPPNAL